MSNTSLYDNYMFFNDFVAPRLRRRALMFAGGDEFTAKELLAGVADVFASKFAYLGDARAVKFGGLLLLQQARDAGLLHRKDRVSLQRRHVGLDTVQDLAAPTADEWQAHVESRLALLDRALASGAVAPKLVAAIRLIGGGASQSMAAAAVGMRPVALSRQLADLGKCLLGRPVARTCRGQKADRKAEQAGQLALFASA